MKPTKWARKCARRRMERTGETYRDALHKEHMRLLRENQKGTNPAFLMGTSALILLYADLWSYLL